MTVIKDQESIVFRDEKLVTNIPGEILLFDMLFTAKHRDLPAETPLYVDIKNPNNALSYGQVKEQALKCAASFKREFNLQRGDVIAVCSPDNIQCPILFFASLVAGCVFSPLRHSSLSSPEEIAYDLDTIRPKLLVLHHTETKTLTTAKNAGIPNILVFSPEKESDIPTGIRTLDEALLSSNELAKPYAYTKDEILNTPCCLYFTSGSTGKRKAVMLSQNVLVSLLLYNTTPLSPSIKHLAPNTFSFVSSLITCVIFTVYFGMSVYILDKKQQTLIDICEAVEKYQISLLSMAPYMAYGLVKEPEVTKKYNLSSVKIVGVGGSSLDKSMASLIKQNTGLVLINFYGMTECPGIFENNPDWTLLGSVGRLGSRSSLRIVSADGKDLPTGQMGELRVKGPTTTL
ncbi:hypothetical protein CU098_002233, partial [Rhizopus stolonifer]